MKILFIDDEPIRAWPLVESRRHDVRIAHGFDQVHFYLERYPGYRPDIVCLDFDMPMMDGYQVAASYLISRAIPVVVHSINANGADQLMRLLQEHSVPCRKLPIHEASPAAWIDAVEEFAASSFLWG